MSGYGVGLVPRLIPNQPRRLLWEHDHMLTVSVVKMAVAGLLEQFDDFLDSHVQRCGLCQQDFIWSRASGLVPRATLSQRKLLWEQTCLHDFLEK